MHLAAAAPERRHVLDDPQNRHPELAQHRRAPHDVRDRQVRGRRDDHGARQLRARRERPRHLARARRRVDDDVVERAPGRRVQQLHGELAGRAGAPRVDLVPGPPELLDQPEAHEREALVRLWYHGPAVRRRRDGARARQLRRQRRTVHVRVVQADARAAPREPARERERHRALAHAAFAGRHGDDALDGGHDAPCWAQRLQCRRTSTHVHFAQRCAERCRRNLTSAVALAH
mmetsp:Transcript_5598/g.16487  ORF Transcript_5598/g.16487 Transcript_5598/m.16487 type:complete len:232 (-) Transcript_5598:42-737(-)